MPYETTFKRRLLLWMASALVLLALLFGAKALGFFDAPGSLKTTMAVVCAIWLAIHVVLFVVITRVGRHPS